MSTDKMREEFEIWASQHRMPLHKDGVVVTYAARCTDEAWQAWQASRATLCVELPTGGYFAGYDNEHMMESRDVRDALDSADVRWK